MKKSVSTLTKCKLKYEKHTPTSENNYDSYIMELITKQEEEKTKSLIESYIIKDEDTNKYIGLCSFRLLPSELNAVVLDISISEQDVNKKYMYYKHILDNLPNLKFNNKNIHKVIIEIKDNDIDYDLAYNSGFTFDHNLFLKNKDQVKNKVYSKTNPKLPQKSVALLKINNHNLVFFSFDEKIEAQNNFLNKCLEEKDTSNYAYQVKYPTSDTFAKYLVMDLDIGEYIGLAILKLAIYERGKVPMPMSVYYAVLKEYRNRGYAKAILRDMVNMLFDNNICDKVNLEISSGNNASLNAAKRMGFENDHINFEIFQEEGYDYIPMSLYKSKTYSNKKRM